MRTSKPFSTISYNSREFLESKILELINAGILDFVTYIEHAPEEDELKSHKHVFFMPSGICDTNALLKQLEEKDFSNPKPLGCLPCRSSKFDDWFLYSMHDKAYLASIGQSRKYHYTISDFRNSNDDMFRESVNHIDRSRFIGTERIVNAVKDSVPFDELILRGAVPIQLINQYKYAYECISTALCRNGRETHTPKKRRGCKPKPTLQQVDLVVDNDGVVCDNPFEE